MIGLTVGLTVKCVFSSIQEERHAPTLSASPSSAHFVFPVLSKAIKGITQELKRAVHAGVSLNIS